MCKSHFRLLTSDEVEARVGSTYKDQSGNITGVSLLLYKDARVDMNILDETFGIYGWKRSHELIDNHLFCTVSVKDPESGEWISKQDVGVESNTEATKGEASDAFKRACFNLGIGRELYTAPRIIINAQQGDVRNGRWTTFFNVKELSYNKDGVISHVVITDAKGNTRYTYGQTPQKSQEELFAEAKAEIDNAVAENSIQMLMGVYSKYVTLRENAKFLAMCKTAKEAIQNAA